MADQNDPRNDPRVVDMDPADVKAALDRGEILLVDVREPYEYGFERIPGALLLPLAQFDPAYLPPDGAGGRTIVLHCGTGRRSAKAVQRCCDKGGAAQFRHVKGGLQGWKEAEQPTLGVDPSTGAPRMMDNRKQQ